MSDRRPDEDVIFDFGYALKHAGARLPIALRQLRARALKHMKLARRKPMDDAHGSALPKDVE